jgi:hypothetical protein
LPLKSNAHEDVNSNLKGDGRFTLTPAGGLDIWQDVSDEWGIFAFDRLNIVRHECTMLRRSVIINLSVIITDTLWTSSRYNENGHSQKIGLLSFQAHAGKILGV